MADGNLPDYYYPSYWDISGYPRPPQTWSPSGGGGQWSVAGGAVNTGQQLADLQSTAQLGQVYYDWLMGRLTASVYMEEMKEDERDKMLASVADAIDSGQNLVSLPYFSEEFYPSYQSMYGQTAGMSDVETAYMESETAFNLARVQEILDGISQSGQVSPDTEAELEYLTQKLEFDMRQANLGNQLDWEEFDLKKQQLELQRNEWLAELQANPATWTERWYAEHLPTGGARIPLQSDTVLAGAQATPQTSSWQRAASTSATASLPLSQNSPLKGQKSPLKGWERNTLQQTPLNW